MMLEISTFLITVLTLLYYFCKRSFTYWEKRGVYSLPNPTVPFGSIKDIVNQKQSLVDLLKSTYDNLKSLKLKHGGIYFFTKPIWIPVDLELIKNILIKDSAYFLNHGMYINEKADPLAANVFFIENEKWKNTRSALTHTFTSGKMKMMFDILVHYAGNLQKAVMDFEKNREVIDIKEYVSRFTMDFIASTAFGLELDTIKNPENDFRKFGKLAAETTLLDAIKFLLCLMLPRKVFSFFNIKIVKPDVERFFREVIMKTVHYREMNQIERKNFLQLLIQLKNSGKILESEKFSDGDNRIFSLSNDEVAAEAMMFFVAGFETSSTTSTFAFLELALNQDIQDKVRDEVRCVIEKYEDQITYEGCMEMNYLEQVIKETLRKYPPGALLVNRTCTRDYKVPGTEVIIEKDTLVMVPVTGVHNDPEIYPDPEKFDPGRFCKNKKIVPNNAFLSFGEGPRICMGMRLGILQTKVAIAAILKDHKVTLNTEKTIYPVELDPQALITTVRDGVWLNITKAT